MELHWNEAIEKIVNEHLIIELKRYPSVIIFGAGESGEWVLNLLRKRDIYPKCFCDNCKEKWGKRRNGLKVFSFEDALINYPDSAICIASMWFDEIMQQIEKQDKDLLLRTWDLLPTMAWETSNGYEESTEKDYIRNNIDNFDRLYKDLTDKKSKDTLIGLLNYRLTRKKEFLKNIKSDQNVYLDNSIIPENLINKIAKGNIIDGGAFNGDTVDMFISKLGKLGMLEIHCYEAENENCKILKEKITNWKPHQVVIHEAALWNDKQAEVFFTGKGLSGKLSEDEKGKKIYIEAIDEYDYNNVSLIKLDIEGAEREALCGAVKTIKKFVPILAICVYHLQDDLINIYQLLKSLNMDYQIILRHYMESAGDTVMYAIPIPKESD